MQQFILRVSDKILDKRDPFKITKQSLSLKDGLRQYSQIGLA